MKRAQAGLFVFSLLLAVTSAHGSLVVAPSSAQTQEGATSGFFGTNMGLVGQELYRPADMPSLAVGSVITGMALRLDHTDSSAFPSSTVTWSQFDISIGPANSSLTSTFANNFASAPTTVRSGPLTMDPGFFSSHGNSPNSFGTMIDFTTPYTYTGGNLLLQLIDVSPNQLLLIDTMTGPTQTSGQSVFYEGNNPGTATVASSGQGPFNDLNWAIEFNVLTAPEPGSLLLLAIGTVGVAGASWRRKRAAARRSAS